MRYSRHELFLLAGQGVENLHKNLSFCVADRSRKNKKALLAVPWYSNEGGSHSKSRFHFCLSLKAGNGGRRTAILSFPQCALRAHFPQSSANRLPANGPFSLSSSPLRYSARVNAFFLIHLYYSRAGGRSQAERRHWHFSGSSAPIQSILCFLQKCLLAKYIPAQMAMASTR